VHVIALNWRDLQNPLGGGAEVHMEEILAYLGRHGIRCTLITSRFPGGKAEDTGDGYRIVRGGGELYFNLAVPALYRRVARADPPDIVLDDINKIPFFSPLFARAPVLGVVTHLMGTTVFQEVNPLLATPIWAAELLMPRIYRHCPFEVISESTRDDLVRRGFARERLHVVHCGMDRETYRIDPAIGKTAEPSLVYVGRIKRYKGIDQAIRALALVRRRLPTCTLTIVGDGDGTAELQALTASLGLTAAVRFAGFLPSAEKVRLLQNAHLLVNPSVKEGWGLTNVEANACGTACVAADSPGLRDSVQDGRTGLLYPWGDVDALADRLLQLLTDPDRRAAMETAGLAWAASLTWDRCGAASQALIEQVVSSG
jgi:glycosyltransferase involved in cell wall biosynthesis